MIDYKLEFNLTTLQKECSNKVVSAYLNKDNILLDAVCGAGKTEMLLECLKIALNQKKKVGLACPRKELLKDLYFRISNYFEVNYFGLVSGDIKKNINSNFIFLTTHQLSKFKDYFDLLIIDEIDAFPFYNNFQLEEDALNASNHFIFLSASVPQKYYKLVKKNKLVLVSNYQRFHKKNMPIPTIIKTKFISFNIIKKLIFIKKKYLIFVPNIKLGKRYSMLFNFLRIKHKFVYSKNISQEIINNFKEDKYQVLVSTTVLERGYTFKNINVLIIQGDNNIYDEATLLQIAGRVGRDSKYYQGDIIILTKKITNDINRCIKRIECYNEMLSM
ncbi:MAG: DEAD/DEAH box helicase family protein [Bacilli bacterium]|jgi:competence protein ComFA|nr:DEAD/DEAH box helicase family protein [Bacilli bacterium]